MEQVLLGYATPLADGWSSTQFFMYRDTDRLHRRHSERCCRSRRCLPVMTDRGRRSQDVHAKLNRNLRDTSAMSMRYASSRLYGDYDEDYFRPHLRRGRLQDLRRRS